MNVRSASHSPVKTAATAKARVEWTSIAKRRTSVSRLCTQIRTSNASLDLSAPTNIGAISTTRSTIATIPLTPTERPSQPSSPRSPQRTRWPTVCSSPRPQKRAPWILWVRGRYSSGKSSETYVFARKWRKPWHLVRKVRPIAVYIMKAVSRLSISSTISAQPSEQSDAFGQTVAVPLIVSSTPSVQKICDGVQNSARGGMKIAAEYHRQTR